MDEQQKVDFIPIDKAAELLVKSPHSVRQLLLRNKLTRHNVGGRIFVDLNDVLSYHAVKKGLPSWEQNFSKIKDKSFVSLDQASTTLMVQQSYIVKLCQQEKLEGYVTVSGELFLAKDSINAYLRTLDHGQVTLN